MKERRLLMKYAVTAATGNFGLLAVNYLSKLVDQKDIIVIARNKQKAQQLFPDFEIRKGNYDSAEEMTDALKGIDRVLFISSQPGGPVERNVQHQNVVSALQKNHVSFVAYTSFANAQSSKTALAADHKLTEKLIEEADIPHSFLRNNWYLENEAGFFESGKTRQKAIYWAGNKAGWALEREYAEAAAKVLTSEKPQAIYEFSGKAVTYEVLGEALNKVLAQPCDVAQVSKQEYTLDLENQGLDNQTAALYASFQDPIDNGSLSETSSDLQNVLGRELTTLSDGIKEILSK